MVLVLCSNPGDSRQCDRLTHRNSEEREDRIMLWFEYDGPNIEGVADRDVEMGFIRENMPPATSCHYDSAGFTVVIWDTKVGVIETYVFDDGRPTVWYFSAKDTAADAWWRKTVTVGETTKVGARWIHKCIKRHGVKEERRASAMVSPVRRRRQRCEDVWRPERTPSLAVERGSVG